MKPHSRALSIVACAALFAGLLAWPPAARAADTGWVSPTGDSADTGGDGNGFEQVSAEAYADGGDYARNMNGFNDRHRYYGFGFDSLGLPANAVITGIEVRLDGWADSTSNNPRYDVELSWNGGGSWTSLHPTSNLLNAESTFSLGGPFDSWGHTWSIDELSDASFRLRITSRASGVGRANRDFFLDWVAVRVHYATADINGTVWADEDGNGIQDGAEAGLSSVNVTIYQDDGDGVFEGGSQDAQVGSDSTGVTGIYQTGPFLEGFSYWVDVAAPAGYSLTTPPEPRLVSLSNANSVTVNFGYQSQVVTNPAIDIAKTPDTQMIVAGSTVTFTIAVTNTGDVSLTSVTVSDALVPNCQQTFTLMLPGVSQRYTCTRANVTADFTNSATASGAPPVGNAVSDTDTAFVDVINPAIIVDKSPNLQTVLGGSTVTFTIALTNTGDVPLANVIVSDTLAPTCARSYATLAVGQGVNYVCTLTNVTTSLTNTAAVSCLSPIGSVVTGLDIARVIVDDTLFCPSNMLAYWKLNESGGPSYDDSYAGHDGACAGQCPTPIAGRVGGAQEFNGSTTGIDVPAGTFINWGVNDSFSIEYWMQTDNASTCAGNQVVVGRRDSSTSLFWWIGCVAGGQAAFDVRDKGNTLGGVAGGKDLTDGSWHHIVAVRDAAQDEIRLYVDSGLEGSTAANYTAGFDSAQAALNIGWLNSTFGVYYRFDGQVDEVALYNRALSTNEILEHFFEGAANRGYCDATGAAPKLTSLFLPIIRKSH